MYDVAIIGLGPTGAVLANLLGQLGVDTVVIDRNAAPVAEPRAAHFDGEVMRVFQTLGLYDEMVAQSRPGLQGMHFVSGQGQTLMVRTASQEPGPHGHYESWYFHQPELEATLRAGLERYPCITHDLGVEAVAVGQDPEQGWVDVEADGSRRRIHARLVVGCEGGRSLTRRAIGASSTDLGQHQPWLCVDVLMQRDVGLADHSVQLCDPARPMTLVNMAGQRRRWEIMVLPDDDIEEMTSDEVVWSFLERWMTRADAIIERGAIYTFHSLVADTWRDGRLLLAGDAAHQTPPFLGQGMCAGVRDAANLAWKLARAIGDDDLAWLDSYQPERRPHVHEFVRLAVEVGEVIQLTDPDAAAERDAAFEATGPELFAFPRPGLGGLGPDPVGQPAPQFRTRDGQWSDDLTGFCWVALTDGQGEPPPADVVLSTEDLVGLGDWLEEIGASWVLVRPDRYIARIG